MSDNGWINRDKILLGKLQLGGILLFILLCCLVLQLLGVDAGVKHAQQSIEKNIKKYHPQIYCELVEANCNCFEFGVDEHDRR